MGVQRNGTAPAIDKIPKDIILCDWHYELRDHYPSVAYFQQKGFRVWPASWNNPKAALAFLEEGRAGEQGTGDRSPGNHLGSATAFCQALCWSRRGRGAQGPPRRRAGRRHGPAGLHERLETRGGGTLPNLPPKGKWTSLFNGKDLTGWTPKIKGYDLGENYVDTFRVEDGMIKVSYDEYTEVQRRVRPPVLQAAVLELQAAGRVPVRRRPVPGRAGLGVPQQRRHDPLPAAGDHAEGPGVPRLDRGPVPGRPRQRASGRPATSARRAPTS